jgi:hypothetical protein
MSLHWKSKAVKLRGILARTRAQSTVYRDTVLALQRDGHVTSDGSRSSKSDRTTIGERWRVVREDKYSPYD